MSLSSLSTTGPPHLPAPESTPPSGSRAFGAPGLLAGVMLVLVGALLWHNGTWGVLETSEARYAEISREMLASGDWLHPRLLGIGHYHKPPLTYWLTAIGLRLFGGGAGAARVLPALTLLAQAGLVYGLGRLLFGDRTRAAAAAAVYVTLPAVLIAVLNVTTDVYLITWELLATYGILRYYHRDATSGLYLFWLGLGLAFLTKGPVGFVLPLMAVASFYFRRGQPRRPFTRHHALGAVLFAVVGVGWYGYLLVENGTFLRYFLVEHTVQRFGNAEVFQRSQPWWYYAVMAPATCLPWAALVVSGTGPARPWRNLRLFWVLVPLVFFSLASSKLVLYVLPVFPGVALLAVHRLSRASATTRQRWERITWTYHGVLLAVAAAAPLLLAALARLGYDPGRLSIALPPAVAVAPLVCGAALVLARTRTRGWARLLLPSVAATLALLLAAKPLFAANEAAFRSARPLAAFLNQPALAGRPVLIYNRLVPSVAFELGRLPVSLYDGNSSLRRETQFEADSAWQRTVRDLTLPGARRDLQPLFAPPSVLLVRDSLDPKRRWITKAFAHRATVGIWKVYY